MADTQKIAIKPRTLIGKRVSQLRRSGVLPGVVFGGHKDSTPVETDMRSFERGYRRWGTTTLLSLEGLESGEVQALIHDVTRSTLTGRLLHVDFLRVSLTEKVHAEVPVHFVGESPAVKAGGVLVHAKSGINVEAFPQDIPHAIEVDLSKLMEVDDSLYVRDLAVDASKVEILDDGDELLVRVVPVRIEVEAPAPVAAAAEGVEGAEAAEAAEGEAPAAAKPGAPAVGAKAGAAPAAGAKAGAAPAAGAKPAAPAAKGDAKKGDAKKG
ncbi:MAG: 50S ribosomal protein L25 [Candidatus Limnocylindria bacterium]|nr:50S ribosomal protein L25 [Candidatus Limnocylindria bacterium]